MKLVLFVHSLRSDWNHGNAHFLRGVASELVHRGHEVVALEPEDGWSAENLARDHGPAALDAWRESYPELTVLSISVSSPIEAALVFLNSS